jgi:hypothetical protein
MQRIYRTKSASDECEVRGLLEKGGITAHFSNVTGSTEQALDVFVDNRRVDAARRALAERRVVTTATANF